MAHVGGLIAAAFLIFVASDLTILHYQHVNPENADTISWIVRLLAVPGRVDDLYVLYAMLPWVSAIDVLCFC